MTPSTSYKNLNQDITLTGSKGSVFNFSTWLKTSSDAAGDLRVSLVFTNSSGTKQEVNTLLTKNTQGGYQIKNITAPINYVNVKIKLESRLSKGLVYFDDVSLSK